MITATAQLALDSARSYLDDNTAVSFSTARLFPMLQEAHRELSARLVLNGVDVIRQQSTIIIVPALNASLSQKGPISLPNTPSNLILPISLSEADIG